ncbi:hypothetical protein COLO4_20852 [Corchorus olitorius]|uniref:Transposase-associated domain-containing protein n=1 Tax=Corchorus olitorius TaxID=93759 RepID=A0A1R3IWK7_9ROSI|nr:hypothetical protein COLO4_20852 [Corchorus olitorius]
MTRQEAFDHLICDGFLKGYVRWIFHGEVLEEYSSTIRCDEEERDLELGHDVNDLLNDIMGQRDMNIDSENTEFRDAVREQKKGHRIDSSKFYSLLKDGDVLLYPGCKTFSRC